MGTRLFVGLADLLFALALGTAAMPIRFDIPPKNDAVPKGCSHAQRHPINKDWLSQTCKRDVRAVVNRGLQIGHAPKTAGAVSQSNLCIILLVISFALVLFCFGLVGVLLISGHETWDAATKIKHEHREDASTAAGCSIRIGGILISLTNNGICEDGGVDSTASRCGEGSDYPDCPVR